jgi:hypothetical protein
MRMVSEFGITSRKDFLIFLLIIVLSISVNFTRISVPQDNLGNRVWNGENYSYLYFNIWGYRNITIIGTNVYDEYNMMNFDQYYIKYLVCTLSYTTQPPVLVCSNELFYIGSQHNLIFIRIMLVIVYSMSFLILIFPMTKVYKTQFLILLVFLLLMISIGLLVNDVRNLPYTICFTMLLIYLIHTTHDSKNDDKLTQTNNSNSMELTT